MVLMAAALAIFIGIVHSVLGEKYILMRLFRQSLPQLFGDDRFTRQTLRFVWHVTSVAWAGFAVVLMLIHFEGISRSSLLLSIGTTFAITTIIALLASRGRHLSWIVFGAIAVICYVSTLAAG